MDATETQRAYDEARFFLTNGQLDEAAKRCARVIHAEPNHAGAVFLRGVIAIEQRDPLVAAQWLEKATQLNPDSAEYFAQLARALILCRRVDDARQAAEASLGLDPRDSLSLDTLGVVFSHLGAHAQAAEIFRRAAAGNPDNPNYQYNLGTSLKFAGDFDGAEQAFTAALEQDPALHKARYALSYLRKQTPDSNHTAELREAWQTVGSRTEGLLHLGYALAKELDDIGEYAAAWDVLSSTNRQWNENSGYEPQQDEALADALMYAFAEAADTVSGYESDEPVFIVGLPRSGTTLTDRILSAHSQVTSAGELNNIGLLTKQYSGSQTPSLLDTDTITKAARASFADLGKSYVDSTRPLTGQTPHFIDKLPHNFLYLGAILAALPNAKVICLRRHPLDVCFGNFRQLFAPRHPYFAYSYDILNCGHYYLLFDRLMQHWQTLYPGRIHELPYESIIDEQEAATRKLLEYCELPWEDACLAFTQNAAPVATASSAQVRAPLNRQGLGRWKNYEAQLQPLRALLEEGGIAV